MSKVHLARPDWGESPTGLYVCPPRGPDLRRPVQILRQAAIALGRDDEVMDRLRRQSFTELLSDDWAHGVEAAVDIALLGRYYERIADHAVSVANRVVYVVTGDFPVDA